MQKKKFEYQFHIVTVVFNILLTRNSYVAESTIEICKLLKQLMNIYRNVKFKIFCSDKWQHT